MTIVPIPCVLAALFGLSTPKDLEKLMISRSFLEKDIEKSQLEIDNLDIKVELLRMKQKLEGQQKNDSAEIQAEKDQLHKDHKHKCENLEQKKQEFANMGRYPTTMWISRVEFTHDTIAKEFGETKKVLLYTGTNGISSIGQVIRASGLLAQEILDYLGVEYEISEDKLLYEHIPPLFRTMSTRFSLPNGPIRYSNVSTKNICSLFLSHVYSLW